ncbi:MAG TPA: hypothetical protein VK762_09090 [Polyangiaceae bacterium]|jgi:hypothetical protein|nr:hypothetical protein [Polyangiaceae bacterium]
MRFLAACLGLGVTLGAAGCNTYADDLSRSQRAFEESEHERALAILRALEPDVARLSLTERTHYAYLRGMTDFRIGYKAESRHWLAIAAASEKTTPGSLPADWSKRMTEALRELNDAVYSGGIASLSNTPTAATKPGEGDEGDEDVPPPPKPKGGDE